LRSSTRRLMGRAWMPWISTSGARPRESGAEWRSENWRRLWKLQEHC